MSYREGRSGVIRKTPGGWNDLGPHLAPRGSTPIVLDATATPVAAKSGWFSSPARSVRSVPSTPISTFRVESSTAPQSHPGETAASLAKLAPRAGFLEKLGSRVPAFKRRFFVLQPGTHLYYFLSPHDTSPRGCLDLQDSWIEEEEGTNQFAVCWDGGRKIVLEARTEEQKTEWIQSLKEERLDYVREDLRKCRLHNSALTSRVEELEQQVQNLRMVEKDRDGALEDAVKQRTEFLSLDEALRRLTLYLGQSKEVKEETKEADEDIEPASSSERDSSLLDEVIEREEKLDVMNVPGTYYGGLYNICEQLRENLWLASEEATSTIQDLNEANSKVEALEKRMAKAEKQLAKFWEENCAVRKALKQTKREKKVLVREVKSLLEAAKTKKTIEVPLDDMSSCIMGSDEEKLVEELEEHVMSSIRLHEQLLAVSGVPASSAIDQVPPVVSGARPTIIRFQESNDTITRKTPIQPALASGRKMGSILDESEDEEDDEDNSALEKDSYATGDNDIVNAEKLDTSTETVDSPERPNPLLQLDEDEASQTAASTSDDRPRPALEGAATSKLVCPLADVAKPRHTTGAVGSSDTQIYHLTFYSRKIGIQFQKIAPPPSRPKGLITEALKSDLTGTEAEPDDHKTAAELRRIAAFSAWSSPMASSSKKGDTCPVVAPSDAVLVCGFQGFDDSGSNIRPKLGARLVAFDGVSVEVGGWTFDSIRKAIKARPRPLTLSFRNDFLSLEQRRVLTKAINDVNPSPRTRTPVPPRLERRPSLPQSIHSTSSHDSEHFINENPVSVGSFNADTDNWSMSVGRSDASSVAIRQSFSATRSVASSSRQSFSEAGSSTSVLSAVAPLVANLLKRNEVFTPEYMKRDPTPVEQTPQHQDFQAELL